MMAWQSIAVGIRSSLAASGPVGQESQQLPVVALG